MGAPNSQKSGTLPLHLHTVLISPVRPPLVFFENPDDSLVRIKVLCLSVLLRNICALPPFQGPCLAAWPIRATITFLLLEAFIRRSGKHPRVRNLGQLQMTTASILRVVSSFRRTSVYISSCRSSCPIQTRPSEDIQRRTITVGSYFWN